MFTIYLWGILFGFGAALAPGPINLEIVRRAVSRGPLNGASFGLGAIMADVIYLTLTSFGVTVLLNNLPDLGKAVMFLFGTVLLSIMAYRALTIKASDLPEDNIDNGTATPVPDSHGVTSLRAFALGLALTLSSPTTIAYWMMVSLNMARFADTGINITVPLILGVLTITIGWAMTVVILASRFHRRISRRTNLLLERVMGLLLALFAAISLVKAGWETVKWKTAPKAVEIERVTSKEINLKWADGMTSHEQGYVVLRSPKPGGPYTEIAKLDENSNTFCDRDVKTSTTYYYKVSTVLMGNLSANSQEVTTATLAN
ncbi:MAG: LysE family transporter [Candidatus Sumerlaeaceae bacterium]|nr:LysE family transporter [Candidatus Sumerlaeaceae bacterium]